MQNQNPHCIAPHRPRSDTHSQNESLDRAMRLGPLLGDEMWHPKAWKGHWKPPYADTLSWDWWIFLAWWVPATTPTQAEYTRCPSEGPQGMLALQHHILLLIMTEIINKWDKHQLLTKTSCYCQFFKVCLLWEHPAGGADVNWTHMRRAVQYLGTDPWVQQVYFTAGEKLLQDSRTHKQGCSEAYSSHKDQGDFTRGTLNFVEVVGMKWLLLPGR